MQQRNRVINKPRLITILPMHDWSEDESEEGLFSTSIRFAPREEEAKNLNTVFSLISSKYPNTVKLPHAEDTKGKIFLHDVTEEALHYLNLHRDEIKILIDALGRYHFRKLLLEKPTQAIALINDLRILEEFNTEYGNLNSLKVSSELGIAAAKCFYEMRYCSFFYSLLIDSNQEKILRNIESVANILSAFKHLNSFYSAYLTQEIFDIVIKYPNQALNLAEAYVKLRKLRTSETEDSRDLKLLIKHPECALIIIQTLEKSLLLNTSNINAIADQEKSDLPGLMTAIKSLSDKQLLTQELLYQLLETPKAALETANKIEQPAIEANPNAFYKTKPSSAKENDELFSNRVGLR